MGTSLLIRIEAGDRTAASRAAEAAIEAVERTDALLSTWGPHAELARLNATPRARPALLSPDLLGLLREARALTIATDGAFDPTVGALVDAWDLRGAGRVPDADDLARARDAVGWRWFRLDGARVSRGHPAAWIDSGGFGKGAALRAARAALEAAGVGRALLNFGGQVLVLAPAGAPAWRIPVADPAHRGHAAHTLEVTSGSVATSGQSEQTHILDPRTGMPVPAWGSVSVVDPDPLRADALATALFVLGPTPGWSWANTHQVAALFVMRDADGAVTIRPTPALPSRARVAFQE